MATRLRLGGGGCPCRAQLLGPVGRGGGIKRLLAPPVRRTRLALGGGGAHRCTRCGAGGRRRHTRLERAWKMMTSQRPAQWRLWRAGTGRRLRGAHPHVSSALISCRYCAHWRPPSQARARAAQTPRDTRCEGDARRVTRQHTHDVTALALRTPRLSPAGRALEAYCRCCCGAAARRLAAAHQPLCWLALRSACFGGRCLRDAALKLRVLGAGLAGMLFAADRARCRLESVAASGRGVLAGGSEGRRHVTAARSAQPAQMTLRPVMRWRCSSTRRVARPPSRAWDPAGRAAVAVDCQRPCVEPRTM